MSSAKINYDTQPRSHQFKRDPNISNSYQSKIHPKSGGGTQSRSTTSQFSMQHIFQVSTANLLPLIQKIKEENEYIKEQKEHMQIEMEYLEGFSNNLLIENEELRSHYHQRSRDVQKIIQTMALNSKEDISDTLHQVHAFRESNRMTIKNIQILSKEIKQLEERSNKLSNLMSETRKQNLKVEERHRNRMVKKRQLQNKIAQLKREQSRIDLQGLQKQLCDLTYSCALLKKKNKATIRFIQKQKNHINAEKPQATHNTIQAIKGVAKVRGQLETIQTEFHQEQLKHQQLSLTCQKNRERLAEIKRVHQKKTLKLAELTQQKRIIEEKKMKADERHKIVNKVMRQEKQYQKSKLEKEIISKKNNLIKQEKNNQQKLAQVENNAKKEINKIKQDMMEIEKNYQKTKIKELNPQMEHCENYIAELLQEEVSLEQQIRSMEAKINGLENPIKEILKLEYQLKRLKK